MTDYPLLVYKSFQPYDNEIVICNLARKENIQNIVKLGNLKFYGFVGIPKQEMH